MSNILFGDEEGFVKMAIKKAKAQEEAGYGPLAKEGEWKDFWSSAAEKAGYTESADKKSSFFTPLLLLLGIGAGSLFLLKG